MLNYIPLFPLCQPLSIYTFTAFAHGRLTLPWQHIVKCQCNIHKQVSSGHINVLKLKRTVIIFSMVTVQNLAYFMTRSDISISDSSPTIMSVGQRWIPIQLINSVLFIFGQSTIWKVPKTRQSNGVISDSQLEKPDVYYCDFQPFNDNGDHGGDGDDAND